MSLEPEEPLDIEQVVEYLKPRIEWVLTSQRLTIIEVLIEHSNQHLTVKEIYDLTCQKNKSIGLATVYRTLDLLVETGLVIKRNFADGSAKYEIRVPHCSEHNHLICKECGKIIEVNDLLPDNFTRTVEGKTGFKVTDYSIKIYGYCAECQTNK
ncbi:MAG: Fur family transcriptional regulator [Bacillota bacterium]